MCSIVGFKCNGKERCTTISEVFNQDLWNLNLRRGRDSYGQVWIDNAGKAHKFVGFSDGHFMTKDVIAPKAMLANFRAEPTNEFRDNKTLETLKNDQQPYNCDDFWGTHNGTIYNDKEILKDATNIPTKIDSYAVPYAYAHGIEKELRGGMATAVYNVKENTVTLYNNWNPLYVYKLADEVIVWCSMPLESHFNRLGMCYQVIDMPTYSYLKIDQNNNIEIIEEPKENARRAVVCLSGGLDSTVAAKVACDENDEVWLAHFDYGCKATSKEIEAIKNITVALRERCPKCIIHETVIETDFFKKLGGSTIVDEDAEVGKGEQAVEKCIDWVPARNTAFFGLLASFCDRYDIGNIYAGLNLEEASSYEDNTKPFFEAFEKVLKAGTHARPNIRMPLGDLMKHEIAQLGLDINAPIEFSWSCYHSGDKHCGECGPCYLRRKAFHMHNHEDLIEYAHDYEGMDPKWKK